MTVRGTASIAGHAIVLTCTALGLLAGACGPRRDRTELAVDLPAQVPQGLALRWERVSGADAYRLRFLRMTGAPLCSLDVDQAKRPSYLVRRDSLPERLASGQQLMVEVRALRHGSPMQRSGMRPLRVP